jgi:hypothetical protein
MFGVSAIRYVPSPSLMCVPFVIPRSPAMTSPTFTAVPPMPFAMYVIGSTIRPALPAKEMAFAIAPALPVAATAPPVPPVKTVVRTLKVTAPAAREGFLPHSSYAMSALPVSTTAVRESRSQEGSLSAGVSQYAAPSGVPVISTPVASLPRPTQACPAASQPLKPTSVPRPLIVPHTPSTTKPTVKSQACSWK